MIPIDGLFNSVGELTAFLSVHTFVLIGVSQLDAGLVRQHLDSANEIQMLDFADECDGIATLAAAKTLVEAELGIHVERRGLLVVERAKPHASAAHAFEL